MGMKYFFVFLVSCLWAEAEVLPLANGNLWIYREAATGLEFAIRVSEPFYINEQVYYSLSGYAPQRLLVRYNAEGALVYYDEENGREGNLTSFAESEGTWWQAPFRPCEQDGQRQRGNYVYEGTAGRFPEAIRVAYRSYGCAQDGVQEEVFADNVGLLRRVHQTPTGTRTFELVYARLGKMEIHGIPSTGFRVTAGEVQNRDVLAVTLRIATTEYGLQRLRFPTAQEWEIEVKDTSGRLVYRWSDGQVFGPAAVEKTFTGQYAQRLDIPKPPPGRYVVEAWMTTAADTPQYRSAVAIEIR